MTPINLQNVDTSNLRQAGRMLTESVACSHGRLQDFSISGAKMVYRGLLTPRIGRVWPVVIGHEGVNLLLSAEVMRVKRLGLFVHDVGVRFIDLNDQDKAKLTEMARGSYTEISDFKHHGEQ